MLRQIGKIEIIFIPHEDQRYDTVGDWYFEEDTLKIAVSKMRDERYQQAVAIHELAEALACNAADVSQDAVDAFDMGAAADLDEPGNDPAAPYHAQHMMATEVEKLLIAAMGVDWDEYDKAVGDHGEKAASQ